MHHLLTQAKGPHQPHAVKTESFHEQDGRERGGERVLQ